MRSQKTRKSRRHSPEVRREMIRGSEPSKQYGMSDRRLMRGKWRRVLEAAELAPQPDTETDLLESLAQLALPSDEECIITLRDTTPPDLAAMNAMVMRAIHEAAQKQAIEPAAQAS